MINDIIKLIFGTGIGTFSTVLNIHITSEIINSHITLITGLVGIVTAGFTIVYLYWQIKKIRNDLKNKK